MLTKSVPLRNRETDRQAGEETRKEGREKGKD